MSIPVRHLPVIQNWDCHTCGNCCRELQVHVSDEERRRIEAQGWEQELGKIRLFVRHGPWWRRRTRLAHRADGACVFLSANNRCRIHERFGGDAKPFACRLYPFVLAPAGSHWRVGVRFSCPSAADNLGRPLDQQAAEVVQYTRLLERSQDFEGTDVPPPPLQGRQRLEWPDVLRFADALLALLEDRRDRVERRLRKCLALAALCRQARFDTIAGGKLVEFLKVVRAGLDADVPAGPADLPRPGWVGRVLFRQLLAIYARKDHGLNRRAVRSRLGLLRAAWRFTRGRGAVPPLNGFLAATTFERVEEAAGPLPDVAEETLARYYWVKVNALAFCGPLHFGRAFWDGLESLALTLPAVLWLARAMNGPREQAVARALSLVDDHFTSNPVFRTRRLRFILRTLGRRGDVERLIAWYSR